MLLAARKLPVFLLEPTTAACVMQEAARLRDSLVDLLGDWLEEESLLLEEQQQQLAETHDPRHTMTECPPAVSNIVTNGIRVTVMRCGGRPAWREVESAALDCERHSAWLRHPRECSLPAVVGPAWPAWQCAHPAGYVQAQPLPSCLLDAV